MEEATNDKSPENAEAAALPPWHMDTPAKPWRRQSQLDREVRMMTEWVAEMVSARWPERRIRKHIRMKFKEKRGKECSIATCNKYIREARALIMDWDVRPRDSLHAESAAFLLSIMADKTASKRDKLAAQKQYTELYGLEPPKETITHNQSVSVKVDLQDLLEAKREVERLAATEAPGVQVIVDAEVVTKDAP